MLSNEIKKLYFTALRKYGITPQIDMLIEEMSELITKICHLKRNRIELNEVCEEFADVEIMIEQIKLIFDCEEKVEEIKKQKLERLKKRLEVYKIDRK